MSTLDREINEMLSKEITDAEAREIDNREIAEMKARHGHEMRAAHVAQAAAWAHKLPSNAVGDTAIRHGIEFGILKGKQKAREDERQRLINIRKDKQDEYKYHEVETERLE